MSTGRFLVGVVELAAIVLPVVFAAVALRRVLLPGWDQAPARLAEVVLSVAGLIGVLELVGVVGLYRPGFVIAGSLLASAAVVVGCRRASGARADGNPPPAIEVSKLAIFVAILAALLVTWHWGVQTQYGLDAGMYLPNTTWHNAPFAARFVQDAAVGHLHFTEPLKLTVWFYAQNSELLHSLGILSFGTDLLSPLLNIFWMVLCLLAAWCIGRPYGVGAAVVVAISLLLDTSMLLLYEPGDAKNDVLGLFGLLAAVAMLVNGESARRSTQRSSQSLREHWDWGFTGAGPLLVAALAAGLAAGTRLNLLAPVALITLAVVLLGPTGFRLKTIGIWLAGVMLTAGFWFLRNLVLSGNPFPWVKAIGPISLPHPDQVPINVRLPGTVADYLGDGAVISNVFVPAIKQNLGDAWIPILLLAAGFAVVSVVRGGTPLLRTLGMVSILSFIAYLFTPLTAAGDPGDASGFQVNMRYAAPAIAVAFAIGPLLPFLLASRSRRRVVFLSLLFLLAITLWPTFPLIGDIAPSNGVWTIGYRLPALTLAVILIVVPSAFVLLWRRASNRIAVITFALLIGIAVLAYGNREASAYVEGRYREETARYVITDNTAALVGWARNLSNERIGIVGTRVAFKQYLLYGSDLSNRVIYVGQHGPHGAYRPIFSCEQFIPRINQLDLDYLVTSVYHDEAILIPRIARLDEAMWVDSDPSVRTVLINPDLQIFKISGHLDAGRDCSPPVDR